MYRCPENFSYLSLIHLKQARYLDGAVEEQHLLTKRIHHEQKKRHRKRAVSKTSQEQNRHLDNQTDTSGYRDHDNTDVHHQTTHRRSRSPKRKRPSTKGQGLRSSSRGRRHKDVPSTSQVSMEMQKCNSRSKATNLKDGECLSTRKPVLCNSDGERFGFKFFLQQCSKIYTNPNRKDRYLLPGVTPGTDVTPEEQTYIMKCVAKEEAYRKPLPYASSKRSVYKYWKEKYGITRRGLCLTNLSDVKSLEEIEAEYLESQQRNEEGIILSQEEKERRNGHSNYTN
ncbi:hypothetical protein BSL78_24509 [Apostichopus japonicus]|uniref:Uncharacterized protein n=1 Tax=Stichopus japonicus TaxID=307972 RepID=A0A2G8JSG9_STIJA|nr:hypothetical protein BSL78_24509 [Apostichopus japonicus]